MDNQKIVNELENVKTLIKGLTLKNFQDERVLMSLKEMSVLISDIWKIFNFKNKSNLIL